MSDLYNNGGSNNGSENNNGSYSYKKDEINQGESYYQWSPYDNGNKNKKPKNY